MADAPNFDPKLLDELAMCFAEAAVRRLLMAEDNSMTRREIPARRTNRGPALLSAVPGENHSSAISAGSPALQRTIPEVLP